MTTCPGSGSGTLDDRAVEATNFSENDCANGATPSEAAGNSAKSLGARQEIADCRSDLVTVRLEGKVAGVEEAHVGVRDVTPERLGAGGRKNGSFLPQAARNGGLCARAGFRRHRDGLSKRCRGPDRPATPSVGYSSRH